ncbi:MAG: NAD(P)H-quinone oxidoreductase subunit 3 [Candidatus Altiarchaeales archaeon HGW-Altiarchaeales-2]|nr:MAG: NAD(P)H-quinone oxidoreductase subunit 3 [Candidatus Altiarchaeales archaeon HGW-Altiarchaeales-2]
MNNLLKSKEVIWKFLRVKDKDKNLNANSGKYETYECGEIAVGNPKFSNVSFKYYIYALMFVVFDIEAVFLFPWAVEFTNLGLLGYAEAMLFIALILVALIYAINKNFLKWTD